MCWRLWLCLTLMQDLRVNCPSREATPWCCTTRCHRTGGRAVTVARRDSFLTSTSHCAMCMYLTHTHTHTYTYTYKHTHTHTHTYLIHLFTYFLIHKHTHYFHILPHTDTKHTQWFGFRKWSKTHLWYLWYIYDIMHAAISSLIVILHSCPMSWQRGTPDTSSPRYMYHACLEIVLIGTYFTATLSQLEKILVFLIGHGCQSECLSWLFVHLVFLPVSQWRTRSLWRWQYYLWSVLYETCLFQLMFSYTKS